MPVRLRTFVPSLALLAGLVHVACYVDSGGDAGEDVAQATLDPATDAMGSQTGMNSTGSTSTDASSTALTSSASGGTSDFGSTSTGDFDSGSTGATDGGHTGDSSGSGSSSGDACPARTHEGDVDLDGSVDPAILAGVTDLAGGLTIRTTVNLRPEYFECLERIQGRLYLYEIDDEAAGTALAGLVGLRQVGDFLGIERTRTLTGVDFLAGLHDVGGRVYIGYNPALLDLDGLSVLTTVGGAIEVELNDAMTSIEGLSSLREVPELVVRRHAMLTTFGRWSGLRELSGDLRLSGVRAADLSAFHALEQVGGDLVLGGKLEIGSLEGLGALREVGGQFELAANEKLRSLDGIDQLQSLGRLRVTQNDQLVSVAGLAGVTITDDRVEISSNPALDRCSIDELLDSVQGLGADATLVITDNLSNPDCPSR